MCVWERERERERERDFDTHSGWKVMKLHTHTHTHTHTCNMLLHTLSTADDCWQNYINTFIKCQVVFVLNWWGETSTWTDTNTPLHTYIICVFSRCTEFVLQSVYILYSIIILHLCWFLSKFCSADTSETVFTSQTLFHHKQTSNTNQ